MSRWRDLLQPERGTDRNRELALPLHHQAAALRARLSTSGTADGHTTARPDARHKLISHSAWYKISVRPALSLLYSGERSHEMQKWTRTQNDEHGWKHEQHHRNSQLGA